MNTLVFEEKKRLKPILISVVISLAFLAVSIGISLLILYLTEISSKTKSGNTSSFSKFLLTYVGPGLNYILARRLMKIHTAVAIRRTTLENWDTAERFEKSLILKTYFFNFFNLFNSFFIIGLFKPLYTYFNESGLDSDKLFVKCRSFYGEFEKADESLTGTIESAPSTSAVPQISKILRRVI